MSDAKPPRQTISHDILRTLVGGRGGVGGDRPAHESLIAQSILMDGKAAAHDQEATAGSGKVESSSDHEPDFVKPALAKPALAKPDNDGASQPGVTLTSEQKAKIDSLESLQKGVDRYASVTLLQHAESAKTIQDLAVKKTKLDGQLVSLALEYKQSMDKHYDTMKEETKAAWDKFWEPRLQTLQKAIAERNAVAGELETAFKERNTLLEKAYTASMDVARITSEIKATKEGDVPRMDEGSAEAMIRSAIAENNSATELTLDSWQNAEQAYRAYAAKLDQYQTWNSAAKPELEIRGDKLRDQHRQATTLLETIQDCERLLEKESGTRVAVSKLLDEGCAKLAHWPSFGWHEYQIEFHDFAEKVWAVGEHAKTASESLGRAVAHSQKLTETKTALDAVLKQAEQTRGEIATVMMGGALGVEVKTTALAALHARADVSDATFAGLQAKVAETGKKQAELLADAAATRSLAAWHEEMAGKILTPHEQGYHSKSMLDLNKKLDGSMPAWLEAQRAHQVAKEALAAAEKARAENTQLERELGIAKRLLEIEQKQVVEPGVQEADRAAVSAKIEALDKQLAEARAAHGQLIASQKNAGAIPTVDPSRYPNKMAYEAALRQHAAASFEQQSRVGMLSGQIASMEQSRAEFAAELHLLQTEVTTSAKIAAKKVAGELVATHADWTRALERLETSMRHEHVVTVQNIEKVSTAKSAIKDVKPGDKASTELRTGLKDKPGGPASGTGSASVAGSVSVDVPGGNVETKPVKAVPWEWAKLDEKASAEAKTKALEDLDALLKRKGASLASSLLRDVGYDVSRSAAKNSGRLVEAERGLLAEGVVYKEEPLNGSGRIFGVAQATAKATTEAFLSEIGVGASADFKFLAEVGARFSGTAKLGGGVTQTVGGNAYAAVGLDAEGSAAANILGATANAMAKAYANGEIGGQSQLKFDDKAELFGSGKGQGMAEASGKAGAKFGADGISVKLSAAAEAAARVEYGYGLKTGYVDLVTKGELVAKARAEAAAKAEAGLINGEVRAGFKLGADAGGGVAVEETRTLKVLGMEVFGTAGAYVGSIGASVSADLTYKEGKLKWNIDLGAALGLGITVKIGGSIDFVPLVKAAEDVLLKIGQAFGDSSGFETRHFFVRLRDTFGLPVWD